MRLFNCLAVLLLAFTGTLAFIIGWRLPAQSRVVAVGVLTGIVASVPTSLLVSTAATRSLQARRATTEATAAAAQPNLAPQIVVLPQQPQPAAPAPHPAAR
jgi:hypothetical protein